MGEDLEAVKAGVLRVELGADYIGETCGGKGVDGNRPDFAEDFAGGRSVAKL